MIKVQKMERAMPTADVGRTLKWEVNGPNGEVQRFHDRSNAMLYASIRRRTETSNEAHKLYANIPMKTCTIKAVCGDRNNPTLATKEWTGVNIMRTRHTIGWCTRQLNKYRHDGVRVQWECVHDQPAEEGFEYHHRFEGYIVRIQGSLVKRGIFEC